MTNLTAGLQAAPLQSDAQHRVSFSTNGWSTPRVDWLARYSMGPMWKYACLLVSLMGSALAAEKKSALQLIELAKSNQADLRSGVEASFDPKDLKDGTASTGHGPDFFFATEAASQPSLIIDEASGPPMQHLDGSALWYTPAHIEAVGRLHSFHYFLEGKPFGGRLDLPAFGPLSYLQP